MTGWVLFVRTEKDWSSWTVLKVYVSWPYLGRPLTVWGICVFIGKFLAHNGYSTRTQRTIKNLGFHKQRTLSIFHASPVGTAGKKGSSGMSSHYVVVSTTFDSPIKRRGKTSPSIITTAFMGKNSRPERGLAKKNQESQLSLRHIYRVPLHAVLTSGRKTAISSSRLLLLLRALR